MDDGNAAGELVVYGLIGDDVDGVEAVAAPVKRQAQLAEDAYLLRLPRARVRDLDAIILRLQDGSTERLPLGGALDQSIHP
jgi:hypothetical protein